LRGVFTHFASADPASSDSAEKQFNRFTQTKQLFLRNGFSDLLYHASATAGTLLSKKYHCDLVRIGIGLYGLYPSAGIERHSRIKLNPVLSWRAVAGEVKKLKKGDSIGYDSTERARGDGEMAVLPVGYWHGVSRSMSSRGMVLVKGTRAKILGRVSMGITVVDVGGLSCKPGDVVTLVGKSGKEEIKAVEAANSAGTIHYEFLTRINPLIERIVR
jgi:alanine racemase